MLDKLAEAIQKLPELLSDPKNFDSLIVNRRKPYTYRVFTHINGYRICLHKFDVCDKHEAFLHPHPWPGAFTVLKGKYEMEVGYSISRTEKPNHVMKVILSKDSMYEIINPLTWHSVTPLEPTYTIMVNGEPWDAETAHTNVVTTKGKDLDKMEPDKLQEHLDMFKSLLQSGGEFKVLNPWSPIPKAFAPFVLAGGDTLAVPTQEVGSSDIQG